MNFSSYDEVRDVIQDGDIVFIKGSWRSIPQSLIMFFTKSDIYHVGVAFWMNTNSGRRLMLVEASGKSQRRIVNLGYYANYKMCVLSSPVKWEDIEDQAFMKIGYEKYGFIEAAYIGLRETMFRLFKLKLPATDLPFEVCSSFVAKLIGMGDYIISPQALYDRLLGMGSKIKKAQ